MLEGSSRGARDQDPSQSQPRPDSGEGWVREVRAGAWGRSVEAFDGGGEEHGVRQTRILLDG